VAYEFRLCSSQYYSGIGPIDLLIKQVR